MCIRDRFRSYHSRILGLAIFDEVNDMVDLITSFFGSETAAMWVTAFATIGLLAATIVLARLTLLLARASSDPQVVANIEPARWSNIHLEYKVANIGTGCAYDVAIEFEPPLQAFRGKVKAKDLPFNDVTMIRPGAEMVSFMGSWQDYYEDEFKISVSWSRKPNGKKRQAISYMLNLKHLHDASTLGNGNGDPLVAIAQDIRKLREGIIPGLSGRKRIKMETYDSADRTAEREQIRERRSAAQAKRKEND